MHTQEPDFQVHLVKAVHQRLIRKPSSSGKGW